jgi:hypothetical protein
MAAAAATPRTVLSVCENQQLSSGFGLLELKENQECEQPSTLSVVLWVAVR